MFSKVSVVLVWKTNQKYIIENLCVNKTKPVLKCNGKCHLMNKLNDTKEDNNAPIPEKSKELKLQPFIYGNLHEVLLASKISTSAKDVISYCENFRNRLFGKIIFIPPDRIYPVV
ncbi:MAG: hypothetical protein IPO92_07685 [Saprospiraceae bacterium]|nr:hypothetical protein [Saprospiraceae bacterium]